MCRRYRGTLSCAVRASGGGGHSHLSCVRVVTVPSLGGGLEGKNILFLYMEMTGIASAFEDCTWFPKIVKP